MTKAELKSKLSLLDKMMRVFSVTKDKAMLRNIEALQMEIHRARVLKLIKD